VSDLPDMPEYWGSCGRLSAWAFHAALLVRDNPCSKHAVRDAVRIAQDSANKIYAIRAAALASRRPPA
jgi:hypothetical protein